MVAKQAVQAIPVRPPRYGLIASAPTIDDGERWQAGFRFAPEDCGASGRVSVGCRGDTDQLDHDGGPGVVDGDPFAVYAWDQCSAFGFKARDYQGRARRQLEATRSFQIAQELWTGELRDADSLGNLVLTDPTSDTLTNGPASRVQALACVESGIQNATQGRQGMVHMTPQLLTHFLSMGVVRLDGSTYVTTNGHIVVPDAGYNGSGPSAGGVPVPAGASQWIYGTSMIGLRLGEIEMLPGTFDEAFDHSTNTVEFYSQELVAYQWDECAHVAAEVDVAVCLTGGAS